jgi:hypothetical protein
MVLRAAGTSCMLLYLPTQAVPFTTADIVDRAGLGCMSFEAIMQEGQNSRTKMHSMASKTIAIMVACGMLLISRLSAAALPSAHHVQRGPIGPDAPKGYVSRFVPTVIRRAPIKSCSWRTYVCPYICMHSVCTACVGCVSALARHASRQHRVHTESHTDISANQRCIWPHRWVGPNALEYGDQQCPNAGSSGTSMSVEVCTALCEYMTVPFHRSLLRPHSAASHQRHTDTHE